MPQQNACCMTLIITGGERQRRSAKIAAEVVSRLEYAIGREERLDLSLRCSWSRPRSDLLCD